MKCPQCKLDKIDDAEFSLPDKRHYHCLSCGYFFSEKVECNRGGKRVRDYNMNIEIVEFYVTERNDKEGIIKGSLHVYLIDIHADLRGVNVSKKGDKWFFSLPWQSAKDIDCGDRVRFPVFSFTDFKKTDALRSLIRKKGIEYIEQTCFKK